MVGASHFRVVDGGVEANDEWRNRMGCRPRFCEGASDCQQGEQPRVRRGSHL